MTLNLRSSPRRSRGQRSPGRVMFTLLAVLAAGLWLAVAAQASDTVTATAPSPVTLGANATVSVPGAQVEDSTNTNQTLQVTVSTTMGTLTLPSNTSNLTLAYGYSSFSGPTITFTGTAANANAALAQMQLTGGGSTGTATISVNVTPSVTGVYYLPATGHYYQFVAASSSVTDWTQAAAAANTMSFDGQEGYLAAVPNATVNNFIDNHLGSGDTNIWAGGQATDFSSGDGTDGADRVWYWGGRNDSATPGQTNYGGPLAGQSFTECTNLQGNCVFQNTSSFFYNASSLGSGVWSYTSSGPDQEPNNSGGTESYLVINYSTLPGKWNDVSDTNTDNEQGYVVEYGDEPTGASSWTGSAVASSSMTLATVPGAPTAVAATPGATGSGALGVSWTAPSNNGNSPVTGYTVTATPTAGGSAAQTCTTTGALSCTVNGLVPGGQYTVSVAATNTIGSGSVGTTTATAPANLPGAPTGLSATPGNAGSTTATVSWSAPTSDGGSPVTGYSVALTPQGGGTTQTCSTTTATTCTISGLTASTTYTVSITDSTAAGTSPTATTSVQSPAAVVPGAPTAVTGTPGGYGSAQIAVAWSAPSNNGNSPITGYTVTATPQGNGSTQACTTTGALSCTVTGLQPGAAYTLSVTATNAIGTGPASSASANVGAPASVPGTPTALVATPGATGSGALAVSWNPPANNGGSAITDYSVTATPQGNGSTQTCSPNGGQSCSVSGLTPGGTYTLTVTATNIAGTGNAATTTATAPANLAGAPTGLSATPGNAGSATVTVSWSAPTNDGGSPITGYNIALTGGPTQTCGTSATTCTFAGLPASTAYTVQVNAETAAGSGPSAMTSVQSPAAVAPDAPTGVIGTPDAYGSTQIDVSWNAPADDGDSPIAGYTVTATPQGSGSPQTCTTTGALNCSVTGLQPGAAYTVGVTATNAIGTGPIGSASASVNAPASVPDLPTALTATAGATGTQTITLSWNAPASNGGSPITGYAVTATPQSGNGGTQSCTTNGALSCSLTSLTPGGTYSLTVVATNVAGTGTAATTTATAPANLPSAPSGVSAIPGSAGSAAVTVSWSAPTSDGGSPITGYNATATPTSGGSLPQTCTTIGSTSCTITSLDPGVAYMVSVTATTAAGTGADATTSVTAPPTVPDAPTGLSAAPDAPGTGTVTLTWTAPSGDGGSPITGYTVSTSSPGDATAHGCSTATTTCTIDGLIAGTDYTFTLAAVNGLGQSVSIAVTAQAPAAAISPASPISISATPTPISPTSSSPSLLAGVASTPATTVQTGLTPSATGALLVPLTCSGLGRCTADGTLTTQASSAGKALELSSFSGVEVGPGGMVPVPASITSAARLALYRGAQYQVRVTLTVNSHLADGETAVSVQHLWMNVSKITGCQNDVGRLTVRWIGRLRIGTQRRAALRTGRHWRAGPSSVRFAVAGGAIRVAFPNAAVLRTVPARRRAAVAGRVMIILTANRHYAAKGMRAGMTVTRARRALHLGPAIKLGGSTWYLAHVALGTVVLQARRGVIREVGVAARSFTKTRADDLRLLRCL